MDRWMLMVAAVFAASAAVLGAAYVLRGHRSRWTFVLMLLSFLAQFVVLSIRGSARGSCPLGDMGEILVFSAWSLTLFYLLVGSVYRLSILGVFTSPLVCILLTLGLFPGWLESAPQNKGSVDAWREAHAAFSVLSYGAFGLAAVAGVMFLVLNSLLKEAQMGSGLFKNLPPASDLGLVVRRLIFSEFVQTCGYITTCVYQPDLR